MDADHLNALSKRVIGAALKVHRHLGPGLLESVYSECLGHELGLSGIAVEREIMLPVSYKGWSVERAFRMDMLVERELIVEVKAVEALLPVHTAQLLSYLKMSDLRLGLLLNFNVVVMREGVKRVVRGL